MSKNQENVVYEGKIKNRLTLKHIFTIPNILSMFRIALIPVIIILYVGKEMYYLAAGITILSCLTDVLDGIIARKFNCVSDLGKVLDPIADKLTQAALMVCLITNYGWMLYLIILMAAKELTMLSVGMVLFHKRDKVNSARWYGKATTVVLFAVMLSLFVFPDIPEPIAEILGIICAGVIIASMVLYLIYFIRQIKNKTSNGETEAVE